MFEAQGWAFLKSTKGGCAGLCAMAAGYQQNKTRERCLALALLLGDVVECPLRLSERQLVQQHSEYRQHLETSREGLGEVAPGEAGASLQAQHSSPAVQPDRDATTNACT